ncbi:transglutaminase family protein [Phaeobacter sp. 22II1-1F12B]|uniref:transglutaminase-like domain-containing protein n=1 Tax=Phaeobacter sp. 22II1-1F12B TaxID=1317111 RepID=UPI000B522E54|nr:transglutaminase domain-containing protein [Phaeobacter sp. 22II1-1F12B]OWU73140.1 transglutaminase [Phaeobacter sp. 22II1-1F12B]
MTLDRRRFMQAVGASAAISLLPRGASAGFAPMPSGWRRFELTTSVEIARDGAPVDLWLPVPAVTQENWARAGQADWTTNADRAELVTDPENGARFLHAAWDAGSAPARLDLVSTADAQDRNADLSDTGAAPLSAEDRAYYTAPTALVPTDGIVKATAESIIGDATGDLEKARLIYDWIVLNTARNPETRGCGLGDVASMLEMNNLTGKCADLNTLFVGLARAAGLPARDVYGLRVAPSRFGYKSLGAGSSDVTKAQHCRAEVFLDGIGWTAVDPADVRKVMLEEPPKNLSLDDPKVADVRAGLFGAWEGNWVAYNFAHDVALPGAASGPVSFLMYPEAEIDGAPLDALDPASFAYTITAREIDI